MVLRNTTPDREKDKFDLNSQNETAVRTIPDLDGLSDAINNSQLVKQNPTIIHVSAPLADTEYSQAIPDGTKAVWVQALKICTMKVYWASGATDYQRISVGGYYHRENLNLTGKTVYFKSSTANNTFVVEYWE